MKKIVLVGELGEIVRSLNECLEGEFKVQLCSGQLENVKAMVKIVKPDIIIICQIGKEEIDKAIFAWIQEQCPQIPTLGIATNEGWKQCQEFYREEQFEIMFRPVIKRELLEKCYRMTGMGDFGEAGRKSTECLSRKRKIMLVDDSALLLRSMKSMLEKDYTVCLAKSGEQALKLIPKENPDLILLDYEMDGMDGRSTFEAMKEDEDMRSIPVVFLTSIADRKAIYSVLKSKPDGYILKPPDMERIFETIEEIFEKQRITDK